MRDRLDTALPFGKGPRETEEERISRKAKYAEDQALAKSFARAVGGYVIANDVENSVTSPISQMPCGSMVWSGSWMTPSCSISMPVSGAGPRCRGGRSRSGHRARRPPHVAFRGHHQGIEWPLDAGRSPARGEMRRHRELYLRSGGGTGTCQRPVK